jgi:hypothetical protein
MLVTAVRAEVVNIAETVQKTIKLALNDNIQVQDSDFTYAVYVGLRPSEGSAISETVLKLFSKPIPEAVHITEELSKRLSIILSEGLQVSESVVPNLVTSGLLKTAEETSSITESLVIYQQSYYADDYHQPGYYGTIHNV